MAGKELGPVIWVFTKRDLENLLGAVALSDHLVIDLETTGLDEHATTGGKSNGGVAARVALAAVTIPLREDSTDFDSPWDGNDPTTYVIPLSHPDSPWVGSWRRVLRDLVSEAVKYRRPISNANLKFDSKWWYATTGVDTAHLILWDTQVSSHLLDETKSTKLKERAPETFGIDRWDEDMDFTKPGAAERADLMKLGDYGARDTYWTWRLEVNHRQRMFLDNPDQLSPMDPDEYEEARIGDLATWVAMPMVASLTRIEQNGFRLDSEWVERQLEEDEKITVLAVDALAERYELPRSTASIHATSKWFGELVEHAVAEGQLIVAAMTKTGNPQWNKTVLGRQARQGSEVARLILEARQSSKRAEYLRSYLSSVTPAGFIHSTYHPGRVLTGRLSSSDPNMQQVTKVLKPAFLPREGHYIVDLDYSQIELRVAAFLSRSVPMMQAYHDGRDLHKMIAAKVVSRPLDEITKEQRQQGKAANFGLLYGQSAFGFRHYAADVYDVYLTEEQSVNFYNGFFDLWTGLREWHADTLNTVHTTGQVVSPLGRVRRLPGIWDSNEGTVGRSEKQALNAAVQGMASDFMQTAAASIQGFTPGSVAVEGVRLVGTVHDSIVGEVPIDGWEPIVEELQDRMERLDEVLSKMGVEFDIPLVADATVGTRWGLGDIQEG